MSLLEGNSGTTAFVFTVSLSNASAQAITVNFATADGSATLADSDYQGGAGSVTFAPGTTSQTITVLVNGDTKFEPDETFTVNLSAARTPPSPTAPAWARSATTTTSRPSASTT